MAVVSVLAVLRRCVGGWLQFAGVWTPVTTGSSRSRAPLVEADEQAGGDRSRRSPSRSGSPVSPSPGGSTSRGAPPAPRPLAGCSSTSSTSTSSTTRSSTSPPSRSHAPLRASSRGRSSRGSIDGVGAGRSASSAPETAPRPDRARPHLRARARGRPRRPRRRLHLGAMTDGSTTTPDPAAARAGRSSIWLAAAARRVGRLGSRRSSRSPRSRFWIDALDALRLPRAGAPVRTSDSWFSDLGVSYHVGIAASRSGSSASTAVVHGGGDRCTRFWVGPRAAARLLRADAVPDRRGRRRLRRPGPAALLRVLGGDADPALCAVGVWGGAGPAARDDQVRHLHDGRLAADARLDRRARPRSRARST